MSIVLKVAPLEEMRRLVTLKRLVHLVEQGVVDLPDVCAPSELGVAIVEEYQKAEAVVRLMMRLEKDGVRISLKGGSGFRFYHAVRPSRVRVTAHGITVTCTKDIPGALRNWVAAARLRLATEGAE